MHPVRFYLIALGMFIVMSVVPVRAGAIGGGGAAGALAAVPLGAVLLGATGVAAVFGAARLMRRRR